jgi:hypothetical protein
MNVSNPLIDVHLTSSCEGLPRDPAAWSWRSRLSRAVQRAVVLLAALLCLGVGNAFALSKPADWSQNDWEKFIEEGVQVSVGEALSHAGSAVPLVDVYSALSSFGSATNVGLRLWLNRKMQDAEDANNMALVDKYQAYASCLDGDCSRLKQQGATGQFAGTYLFRGIAGQACQIQQLADGTIIATTEKGEIGKGKVIDQSNFVVTFPFGEQQGTLSADGTVITWSNGEHWMRS